jgi:hypothetical protein
MTEDDILGFVPDDSGETEITLTVSNGEDEVEDSVTVHVK